ncbi:MAG: endonuclease domain-containing protein [Methylobacter sp.]|nr:endonuclease domain-containing protein [Methylobacter sp.]
MKPYNPILKPFSRKLRSNMTDAEHLMWSKLRRKQILGLQFYRQKPLASYIVDFYCAAANLVIELDGSQHFEPGHQTRDAKRDQKLESMGIKVLRFDNHQVLTELDAVMSVVFNTVEKQIPPNPPFTKGGIKATATENPRHSDKEKETKINFEKIENINPEEAEKVKFEEKAEAINVAPFEKWGPGGFSKKGGSA